MKHLFSFVKLSTITLSCLLLFAMNSVNAKTIEVDKYISFSVFKLGMTTSELTEHLDKQLKKSEKYEQWTGKFVDDEAKSIYEITVEKITLNFNDGKLTSIELTLTKTDDNYDIMVHTLAEEITNTTENKITQIGADANNYLAFYRGKEIELTVNHVYGEYSFSIGYLN